MVDGTIDQDLLPFVSIVIPVYADSGGVVRCVKALREQNFPNDRFEVVLVDNGRNPDFSWVTKEDSWFRVIEEKQPGSYAARNAGIQAASGNIIAFTDADCIPDHNWVAAGVRAIGQHSGCGSAGGRIAMFFEHPSTPKIAELYDSVVNLDQKTYIMEEHFSATANLFAKAAMFEVVGLFDAGLRSGGDRDWGERLHAAGYELIFAPDAVVNHPARSSLKECIDKARRVSGGNINRLRKQGKLGNPGSVARFIAEGLLPPMTQWRRVRKLKLSLTAWRRLSLFAFMTMMKYVRTLEAVRVMLGGNGKR